MTWLLSRALIRDYENSPSLPGAAAESSLLSYSDGEPFAASSSTNMPLAFYVPAKTTGTWNLSRYGMTLEPLTASLGEAVLTWFRAAFPVRTSVPLGRGRGLTARNRGSGFTWPGSLAKYDPKSRSWKIPPTSEHADWIDYSGTYPRSGTMRAGELSERPMLVPRTSVIACGLLPTPTATPYGSCQGGVSGRDGQRNRQSLHSMAKHNTWPTPTVPSGGRTVPTDAEWVGRTTAYTTDGTKCQVCLSAAVKRWPTPQAHDAHKGNPDRVGRFGTKHGGRNLNDEVAKWPTPTASMTTTQEMEQARFAGNDPRRPAYKDAMSDTMTPSGGGSLNPSWVEWLMGWPLGWTDLDVSAMDKSPWLPWPHGSYSPKIDLDQD